MTQAQELAKFNREFENMKPLVHERSKGKCEATAFAVRYVTTKNPKITDDEWPHDAFISLHDRCTGYATQVHHRKYRGRSRGGTNALINLLDVCDWCHSWIHAHGKFGGPANLLGLALSAGESEDL